MVDFGSQHGAVLFELTARSDPQPECTWLFAESNPTSNPRHEPTPACLLQQEIGTGVSSKRHCIAIVLKQPDRLLTYQFCHQFPPITPSAIKEAAQQKKPNTDRRTGIRPGGVRQR